MIIGMHHLTDPALKLGLTAVLAALASLVIWLRLGSQWTRRLRSINWTPISGTIENGTVSTIRTERRELVTCTLNYSYQVNGEYFGGAYLRQFTDEQAAYDYIDSMNGKLASVKYNPREPGCSILT
ncbi:MAG TPA: DUF3592 domain-containing protein [Terriglobales bacterium]|nr:DUF3592 domain-containing protein [Terriglobales bacterium]